jgi:Bacteriophage tail sheath protein
MCAFVAINKAPGVYIEEVQLPGPIAGVATSTAAFVGPARRGPLNKPVRLANWTEFVDAFGFADDFGPYIPFLPIQVTPAVHGFFENGGSDCFFVRVGTGAQSSLALKDRSAGAGRDTLVVKASEDGTQGDSITVEVQDASIATTTAVKASATIAATAGSELTVTQAADAAKFRPEDVVFIDDNPNSEWATVAAVSGTTITMNASLTHVHAAGEVRADLAAAQKRIRVSDLTGLEPGSYVAVSQGGPAERHVVQAVERPSGFIILADGLANRYQTDAASADVDIVSLEFTLVVARIEKFEKLAMDPRHSRYFLPLVDSDIVELELPDPPNPTVPPDDLPRVVAATNLAGGADDTPEQVTTGAFTNAFQNGIDTLRKIDEVNILCVPDRSDQDVQVHMIAHCESMQDRFTILDPQARATSAQIETQRDALGSDGGYAALYYPRIVVSNPTGPGRITIAPSGHLAGLYALVDDTRGVFKAPANQALRGVLDLERRLADEDQGPLNEKGINVIRSFPGRGAVVWGARTISTSTQWRYVSVRRLLLFIEESLQEGTQFVVFEPNEPSLWEKVKRQVTDFLTRQWTAGALVGVTPADGFSVRVDAELNPPSVVALGQLVIEVKLFPAPPAEFVVFRIIQRPGGPEIQE